MFLYLILGFLWALGYTVFQVFTGKKAEIELVLMIVFNFVLWPVAALITISHLLKGMQ